LKLIVQLLIAALIVYATAHVGAAAWKYYQFRDAVEQEARFGNAKSTSALHRRVLEVAGDHGIELAFDDVAVQREGEWTRVTVRYVDVVQLVPELYSREQELNVDVSVRVSRPLTVDDFR
jgi:hypothetical protein